MQGAATEVTSLDDDGVGQAKTFHDGITAAAINALKLEIGDEENRIDCCDRYGDRALF